MEAQRESIGELSWQSLAVLLADDQRSELVRGNDLVYKYPENVLMVRKTFSANPFLVIDHKSIMLQAPAEIADEVHQLVFIEQLRGAQGTFSKLLQLGNVRVYDYATDKLTQRLDSRLKAAKKQLRRQLKLAGINPATYTTTESP